METPSSTARRITRSQTASNNIPLSRKKMEESEKKVSKTRQRNGNVQQQDHRCALIDISNDSPIVGVANGKDVETPLSSVKKRVKKTPGSGEALLRGQVKTLLQKVEEEAVISKLSMQVPHFVQLVNSPMSLLAPTPANTPQISNLSCPNHASLTLLSSPPSAVVQEQLISLVGNEIDEGKNDEKVESEKSVITRSLLLDFSDKSEVSECSSEVTHQEVTQGSSGEDDGASIWSIQVNASIHDEDEDDDVEMGEEEEEEEYYEDAEDEEECYDDVGGLSLDELCAGLNNISVNEKGKHTRFVYDSDDELVEKVEVASGVEVDNVLHLKGLPTPKGKHLRFHEEEENSDL